MEGIINHDRDENTAVHIREKIEIPTSLLHVYEIDAANGNTFWQDVIRKEMTNIGIVFEILGNDMKMPTGWNMVQYV
eukprot:8508070-Ditylum_brightwellii.AAC.1